MNKKNNQLVPVIFLISIVIFLAIVIFACKSSFETFSSSQLSYDRKARELKQYEEQYSKEKEKIAQEEIQLNSIKPVYKTNMNGTSDNMSTFGTMFDDIIKLAQQNGLYIRSIEYDTKPAFNEIYNNFSDTYNVCELKFFFVGSYNQLKTFLYEVNTNLQYLVSISKLDITAFENNTDYLLMNVSIVLYSKKASSTD